MHDKYLVFLFFYEKLCMLYLWFVYKKTQKYLYILSSVCGISFKHCLIFSHRMKYNKIDSHFFMFKSICTHEMAMIYWHGHIFFIHNGSRAEIIVIIYVFLCFYFFSLNFITCRAYAIYKTL